MDCGGIGNGNSNVPVYTLRCVLINSVFQIFALLISIASACNKRVAEVIESDWGTGPEVAPFGWVSAACFLSL
jgi:hypothetical protein